MFAGLQRTTSPRSKMAWKCPLCSNFVESLLTLYYFKLYVVSLEGDAAPAYFLKANPFCWFQKHVHGHKICQQMAVLTSWQTHYRSVTDSCTRESVLTLVSVFDCRGTIKRKREWLARKTEEKSVGHLCFYTYCSVVTCEKN